MPKVTEAHLEARRRQILDAAWACFARKGYHQTTMQDICQESELSPGAIYRYFASKEEILKAINDRSQEMGRALAEEARALAGGSLDALAIIGETMLAVFHDPTFETTARVNIEILPEIIRDEGLRKNLRHELTFWRKVVSELLMEAKAQGQLRPEVDPESLAVLIICAWAGLRQFRLIDPQTFKPETLSDLVRALMTEERRVEAEKFAHELATGESSLGPPFGAPRPQRGRRRKKEVADVRLRNR